MTKKPKLPKVWVAFEYVTDMSANVPIWVGSREALGKGVIPSYQYAPVQKPKVCRWKPSDVDWWEFSCNPTKVTADKPRIYCQFCGGKIKIKVSR